MGGTEGTHAASGSISAESASAVKLSAMSLGRFRFRFGPKTSLKGCVARRLLLICVGLSENVGGDKRRTIMWQYLSSIMQYYNL